MSMKKSLDAAENRARIRDYENEEVLSNEELHKATELQHKANLRGMKLVPERKVKSKVRFAQVLQINLNYLRDNKYLTGSEKNFVMDIIGNVGFLSNCIVDDIQKKSPVPLTQTEVAEVLGRRKQNVNPIIKSLIDKGILARAESGIEDNNVRAYALFFNPNIVFSGDKDQVNESLKAMFHKVMTKNKILKNLPEKLW